MARRIVAKHLDGIGDLVVAAPIKTGFIDAFEAVTYETRLRYVLKALFRMRATAREYSQIKPFTDVAERIQSLLDYRLAVIETPPGKTLVLTATFDRAWEPYMRLIWRPLGPFLDLLFCNCVDYPIAADSSFETFAGWVRAHQLSSDFFFSTYGLSVGDINYLSAIEQTQREGSYGDGELAACKLTARDPEALAAAVRDDPSEATQFSYNDMAMEALVALYRLTDHYPADRPTGDGRLLLRATQELLRGWEGETLHLKKEVRDRFAAQLAWYESMPPPSAWRPDPGSPLETHDVQGGILTSYDAPGRPITHGALLLLRIDDAADARAAIATLGVQAEGGATPADGIFVNIAFTLAGLARIGVPAAEIDRFPPEFHEGMIDRGGLIGDVRGSHARRWRLPRRWPGGVPVDLSEVDIVVQLRVSRLDHAGHEIAGDPAHPLFDKVAWIDGIAGLHLLAVEPMRRATLTTGVGSDHFGFADLISQPQVVDPPLHLSRDEVPPGEIICGHANRRGDGGGDTHALQHNGSFLVVRKLRQDQPGLAKFVDDAVAANPGLDRETVYGKLIGRRRDGTPMVPGGTATSNEFDYDGDADGGGCPFQAHIRRANPRSKG